MSSWIREGRDGESDDQNNKPADYIFLFSAYSTLPIYIVQASGEGNGVGRARIIPHDAKYAPWRCRSCD